jgi:hypothetical protein
MVKLVGAFMQILIADAPKKRREEGSIVFI